MGDLKRIFSNVQIRGTWAGVQVGGILEQMLTPDQWSKNVCVKEGSLERVECAIRLPGQKDDASGCMWLPIDSKFPTEDYARLQIAAEAGDPVAVQSATDALLRALKLAAHRICMASLKGLDSISQTTTYEVGSPPESHRYRAAPEITLQTRTN